MSMSKTKPIYTQYYFENQRLHADVQERSWKDAGLRVERSTDKHGITLKAYPPNK